MRGRVVEEPAQHAAVQADRPCKLYIRTQVHTGGGVMHDTQNRGAHLRMTVPLTVRAAAAVLEEGEAGETGVQ